jgi:hypothetical protein
VGYVPETVCESFALDGENLNKLINGYIGFLKKSKQGAHEPGANYSIRENSPDYLLDDNLMSSPESNID